MSAQISCQCGKRYSIGPQLAGKLVKCTSCGAEFRVPEVLPATRVAEQVPTARRVNRKASDDTYGFAASKPESRAPSTYTPSTMYEPDLGRSREAMPESARNVCLTLSTAGFLFTIFAGMGIYLMVTDKVDPMGQAITACLAVLAIGGYVGAVSVRLRVRGAMPIVIVLLLPYLLFVPLGTILGVVALRYLIDPATKEYLA